MSFYLRWLGRRLGEADRIASEETPYKPSLRLESPPLDETGEKPRYGFWLALMFLALLSSPAWGLALGYIVFANFYDGSRATGMGVAAGMTFTPVLMFASIILFEMYKSGLMKSRRFRIYRLLELPQVKSLRRTNLHT